MRYIGVYISTLNHGVPKVFQNFLVRYLITYIISSMCRCALREKYVSLSHWLEELVLIFIYLSVKSRRVRMIVFVRKLL